MRNKLISFKFKCEDKENIQYYYEGIMTDDFSNAGIIEFNRNILNQIINFSMIKDFTGISAMLFIERKMRVVRLCKYPLISEDGEDYHAIYAFARIIERYFYTQELPKN